MYCRAVLFVVCYCFVFFFLCFIYSFTFFFFFSSRRRHTRCLSDWSSDVCSSDLRWPRTRWPARCAPPPPPGRARTPSPPSARRGCGSGCPVVPRRVLPASPRPRAIDSGPRARRRSEERRVGKEGRCGGAVGHG